MSLIQPSRQIIHNAHIQERLNNNTVLARQAVNAVLQKDLASDSKLEHFTRRLKNLIEPEERKSLSEQLISTFKKYYDKANIPKINAFMDSESEYFKDIHTFPDYLKKKEQLNEEMGVANCTELVNMAAQRIVEKSSQIKENGLNVSNKIASIGFKVKRLVAVALNANTEKGDLPENLKHLKLKKYNKAVEKRVREATNGIAHESAKGDYALMDEFMYKCLKIENFKKPAIVPIHPNTPSAYLKKEERHIYNIKKYNESITEELKNYPTDKDGNYCTIDDSLYKALKKSKDLKPVIVPIRPNTPAESSTKEERHIYNFKKYNESIAEKLERYPTDESGNYCIIDESLYKALKKPNELKNQVIVPIHPNTELVDVPLDLMHSKLTNYNINIASELRNGNEHNAKKGEYTIIDKDLYKYYKNPERELKPNESDHCFGVLNLSSKADLRNPETFGKKAVVFDPWFNFVGSPKEAMELYKKEFNIKNGAYLQLTDEAKFTQEKYHLNQNNKFIWQDRASIKKGLPVSSQAEPYYTNGPFLTPPTVKNKYRQECQTDQTLPANKKVKR